MRTKFRFVFILALFQTYIHGNRVKASDFSPYIDPITKDYFVNKNVKFHIKGDKNTENIFVAIDEGNFSQYSDKIQFDSEGFHIIRFKGHDPVLNWSPVESFRVHVDTTPPVAFHYWQGPLHIGEKGSYVSQKTELHLEAHDNLSGAKFIRWQYGGSEKSYRYKDTLKFKKEGKKSIRYMAQDHVKNQTKWVDLNFILDSKAPNSKVTISGKSHTVKNKKYLGRGSFLSIKSEDNASGIKKIEYQVNDGKIREYKGKIAVKDQLSTLKFRAIDQVGNTEKWQEVKVYLDTQSPTLAIDIKGKYRKIASTLYAKSNLKIMASLRDSQSGPSSFRTTKEGLIKGSKHQFTFPKSGAHKVSIYGTDRVGNYSETKSYDIFIDNTPPTTSYKFSQGTQVKDKTIITALPNSLSFESKDTGAGLEKIQYSYDKKNILSGTTGIDLATWKKRAQTVYYRSIDTLGNKEKWKSVRVKVLKDPPQLDLIVEPIGGAPLSLAELQKRQRGEKSSSKRKIASGKEKSEKKKRKKKRRKKRKRKNRKKKN